jgi:hypothetical protein
MITIMTTAISSINSAPFSLWAKVQLNIRGYAIARDGAFNGCFGQKQTPKQKPPLSRG